MSRRTGLDLSKLDLRIVNTDPAQDAQTSPFMEVEIEENEEALRQTLGPPPELDKDDDANGLPPSFKDDDANGLPPSFDEALISLETHKPVMGVEVSSEAAAREKTERARIERETKLLMAIEAARQAREAATQAEAARQAAEREEAPAAASSTPPTRQSTSTSANNYSSAGYAGGSQGATIQYLHRAPLIASWLNLVSSTASKHTYTDHQPTCEQEKSVPGKPNITRYTYGFTPTDPSPTNPLGSDIQRGKYHAERTMAFQFLKAAQDVLANAVVAGNYNATIKLKYLGDISGNGRLNYIAAIAVQRYVEEFNKRHKVLNLNGAQAKFTVELFSDTRLGSKVSLDFKTAKEFIKKEGSLIDLFVDCYIDNFTQDSYWGQKTTTSGLSRKSKSITREPAPSIQAVPKSSKHGDALDTSASSKTSNTSSPQPRTVSPQQSRPATLTRADSMQPGAGPQPSQQQSERRKFTPTTLTEEVLVHKLRSMLAESDRNRTNFAATMTFDYRNSTSQFMPLGMSGELAVSHNEANAGDLFKGTLADVIAKSNKSPNETFRLFIAINTSANESKELEQVSGRNMHTHWNLACIQIKSGKAKELFYVEPKGADQDVAQIGTHSHPKARAAIAAVVKAAGAGDFSEQNWQKNTTAFQKPQDNTNCGVYVIKAAEAILANVPIRQVCNIDKEQADRLNVQFQREAAAAPQAESVYSGEHGFFGGGTGGKSPRHRRSASADLPGSNLHGRSRTTPKTAFDEQEPTTPQP